MTVTCYLIKFYYHILLPILQSPCRCTMSFAGNNLARKSMALGPSVKLLLSRHAIDPKTIPSTGPHKILLKSDVLSFLSSKSKGIGKNILIEESFSRIGVGKRGEVTVVIDEQSARKILARKPVSEEEIEIVNSGGSL